MRKKGGGQSEMPTAPEYNITPLAHHEGKCISVKLMFSLA